MHVQISEKVRGLRHLVGNSPILVVNLTYRGERRTLYAKAEHLNMTGSIKDRMALHIIRLGYERDLLRAGAPIVEATSGNTGISFAGIGVVSERRSTWSAARKVASSAASKGPRPSPPSNPVPSCRVSSRTRTTSPPTARPRDRRFGGSCAITG
jgi:hypothetical protein